MMKKVTYPLTIVFALALMSMSCEKEDPIVPDPETLEEQYPEWSDLFWVSTDGSTTTFPRLDIIIDGNEATLYERKDLGVAGIQLFPMAYESIELTSSTITFTEPITNSGAIEIVYEILTPDEPGTVKLRHEGNTYVLR